MLFHRASRNLGRSSTLKPAAYLQLPDKWTTISNSNTPACLVDPGLELEHLDLHDRLVDLEEDATHRDKLRRHIAELHTHIARLHLATTGFPP